MRGKTGRLSGWDVFFIPRLHYCFLRDVFSGEYLWKAISNERVSSYRDNIESQKSNFELHKLREELLRNLQITYRVSFVPNMYREPQISKKHKSRILRPTSYFLTKINLDHIYPAKFLIHVFFCWSCSSRYIISAQKELDRLSERFSIFLPLIFPTRYMIFVTRYCFGNSIPFPRNGFP